MMNSTTLATAHAGRTCKDCFRKPNSEISLLAQSSLQYRQQTWVHTSKIVVMVVTEAPVHNGRTTWDSILNVSVEDDGTSSAMGGGTGTDGNELSNQKCRQVLAVFYSLIGCGKCSIGQLSIPLSVKAHLLLRALLRLPHDKFMIPW